MKGFFTLAILVSISVLSVNTAQAQHTVYIDDPLYQEVGAINEDGVVAQAALRASARYKKGQKRKRTRITFELYNIETGKFYRLASTKKRLRVKTQNILMTGKERSIPSGMYSATFFVFKNRKRANLVHTGLFYNKADNGDIVAIIPQYQ